LVAKNLSQAKQAPATKIIIASTTIRRRSLDIAYLGKMIVIVTNASRSQFPNDKLPPPYLPKLRTPHSLTENEFIQAASAVSLGLLGMVSKSALRTELTASDPGNTLATSGSRTTSRPPFFSFAANRLGLAWL